MPARTRAAAPTGHSRGHSFPALCGDRSDRSDRNGVVSLRTRNRDKGARAAAEAGNRLSHG